MALSSGSSELPGAWPPRAPSGLCHCHDLSYNWVVVQVTSKKLHPVKLEICTLEFFFAHCKFSNFTQENKAARCVLQKSVCYTLQPTWNLSCDAIATQVPRQLALCNTSSKEVILQYSSFPSEGCLKLKLSDLKLLLVCSYSFKEFSVPLTPERVRPLEGVRRTEKWIAYLLLFLKTYSALLWSFITFKVKEMPKN